MEHVLGSEKERKYLSVPIPEDQVNRLLDFLNHRHSGDKYIHEQNELILAIEKGKENVPPCHAVYPEDRSKWCDHNGLGGFMGHTCGNIRNIVIREAEPDKINHPAHYGGDVPHEAIKCIAAWGLNFQLGNAVKYIRRSVNRPGPKGLEDINKAVFYLQWEIARLEKLASNIGQMADPLR